MRLNLSVTGWMLTLVMLAQGLGIVPLLASAGGIPSGRPVQINLSQTLDADNIKEGETVRFSTLTVIREGDTAIVPAGAIVTAKVVRKKNNFIFGVPGMLTLGNFQLLFNEEVFPLSCTVTIQGEERYAASLIGGWLILLPFFIKGEDAKAVEGSQYTCQTF